MDVSGNVYQPDLDAAFAQIGHALKPGGRLVIHTSPNRIFEDDVYRHYVRNVNRLFVGVAKLFNIKNRLLNELGQTIFERAKQHRGAAAITRRRELLGEAVSWFQKVLELDPENVAAHYNLALLADQLDQTERAEWHRTEHARYKPDDNARHRAVPEARLRYPAAHPAAAAIVTSAPPRAVSCGPPARRRMCPCARPVSRPRGP